MSDLGYDPGDYDYIHAKAPDDMIYVCAVCGKTSKTRAPTGDSGYGWDESCMLNCVLVKDDKPEGVASSRHKWTAVPEDEIPADLRPPARC